VLHKVRHGLAIAENAGKQLDRGRRRSMMVGRHRDAVEHGKRQAAKHHFIHSFHHATPWL
jgi:hypothetical protein